MQYDSGHGFPFSSKPCPTTFRFLQRQKQDITFLAGKTSRFGYNEGEIRTNPDITTVTHYLSGLARRRARFAISSHSSSLFQNSSAWQCVANEYGGLYSATALNSLG